jgi:hypothetical protein
MNRREFIGHSALGLVVTGVSGCATTDEWKSYHEAVSSVLISSDEHKLVVMTAHYHYIFDAAPGLVGTLKGTFHPYVKATFGGFRVFKSGRTLGTVTLILSNAPGEAVDEAVAAGFERDPKGAELVASVEGQRYRAGVVKTTSPYSLNKSYDIEVSSEQSQAHLSETPIKVVGGALVLGYVVLLPATVLAGCAMSGSLHNCHE